MFFSSLESALRLNQQIKPIAQEAFAKSLVVLTNAEKDILFRLQLKLYEQDKQMIIIPNDESNSFDVSYVKHKRHKRIPLEEDNVLKAGKTPDIE